jgi:3-hydroxymyristoyl/3-hydroxydecanoyl-(acyl carrier protein) dehydratase
VPADDQTRQSTTIRIASSHPSLAGHFPGNPIVPGVVLLDEVVSAAEGWLGTRLAIRGLPRAKFLAPLLPEEKARVELVIRGPLLEFAILRGETTIATGVLQVAWESQA